MSADEFDQDEAGPGPWDEPVIEESPLVVGARSVVEGMHLQEDPVLREVEHDIAVSLGHLDSVESLHQRLRRSLLRDECDVGTDLLRLRVIPYSTAPPPDRSGLKRRLLAIEAERRRLAMDMSAQRRSILDRLAALVSRRRQLAG